MSELRAALLLFSEHTQFNTPCASHMYQTLHFAYFQLYAALLRISSILAEEE